LEKFNGIVFEEQIRTQYLILIEMKQFIVILLAACIFTSCSSTNRIIEINNSKKEENGFRLMQNARAHAIEKSSKTIINQFFNIQTNYLFEVQTEQNPVVTLEFSIKKPFLAEKLDSVMFLKLDSENIRIVSSKSTPIMAESSPAVADKNNGAGLFIIPENLWLSIANSKSITYKLSCGHIGIEIKPDPVETTRLKEFYNKAMQRRLEIIPLVPPGKSKW
jgi:hypothetical protein